MRKLMPGKCLQPNASPGWPIISICIGYDDMAAASVSAISLHAVHHVDFHLRFDVCLHNCLIVVRPLLKVFGNILNVACSSRPGKIMENTTVYLLAQPVRLHLVCWSLRGRQDFE